MLLPLLDVYKLPLQARPRSRLRPQYSVQMLTARDKSMYQREQSQPGGGGAQQLEARMGIGKANAR